MTASITAKPKLNIPRDYVSTRRIFGHRMIDEQCSALPFDEREYVYAIVCGDKFLLTVRGIDDDELTTLLGEKASIDKKTFTIGGNAYTIESEEFACNGAVYFLKTDRDLFKDMAKAAWEAIANLMKWKDDVNVKHKEVYLKGFNDGAANPFVYLPETEQLEETLKRVNALTDDDPRLASLYALALARGSGVKAEKGSCLFPLNEVRKMEHVHKFLMTAKPEIRLNIPVVSTNVALDTRVYPQESDSKLSVLNVLSNAGIEVGDSDLNEILNDACAPRVYEPLGFLVPSADIDVTGDSILTFNDIWQSNDKFVEPIKKVETALCIDLHLARVLKQLYMCNGILMDETGGGAAAPAQGSKGKIKPLTLREFLEHVL